MTSVLLKLAGRGGGAIGNVERSARQLSQGLLSCEIISSPAVGIQHLCSTVHKSLKSRPPCQISTSVCPWRFSVYEYDVRRRCTNVPTKFSASELSASLGLLPCVRVTLSPAFTMWLMVLTQRWFQHFKAMLHLVAAFLLELCDCSQLFQKYGYKYGQFVNKENKQKLPRSQQRTSLKIFFGIMTRNKIVRNITSFPELES